MPSSSGSAAWRVAFRTSLISATSDFDPTMFRTSTGPDSSPSSVRPTRGSENRRVSVAALLSRGYRPTLLVAKVSDPVARAGLATLHPGQRGSSRESHVGQAIPAAPRKRRARSFHSDLCAGSRDGRREPPDAPERLGGREQRVGTPAGIGLGHGDHQVPGDGRSLRLAAVRHDLQQTWQRRCGVQASPRAWIQCQHH